MIKQYNHKNQEDPEMTSVKEIHLRETWKRTPESPEKWHREQIQFPSHDCERLHLKLSNWKQVSICGHTQPKRYSGYQGHFDEAPKCSPITVTAAWSNVQKKQASQVLKFLYLEKQRCHGWKSCCYHCPGGPEGLLFCCKFAQLCKKSEPKFSNRKAGVLPALSANSCGLQRG